MLAIAMFLVGALVSLTTSWLLVSRLERLGARFGLGDGLLGILAALAADAPEITTAVTALINHEQQTGAGVILGSNVFNLAALLGLASVAAGRVRFHPSVVIFNGVVAGWVAAMCLLVVIGLAAPPIGLLLSLLAVIAYVAVLGVGHETLRRLPLPGRWIAWLSSSADEEAIELHDALHPGHGGRWDAVVTGLALVVVVTASVAMERAASSLGARYAVPEIILGGLVLAAVTSLPNAVAAWYLAVRGRGAAVLSTAVNSNTLNVVVGLLIPATIVGISRTNEQAAFVAAWYAGLTAFALLVAHRQRGLDRRSGLAIIALYLVFVGSLVTVGYHPARNPVKEPHRIVLAFPEEGVSIPALLLEDQAPKTCEAVWRHLPSGGFARHGIYSGSEVYALWSTPFIVERENQTSDVLPGDVAYYYQPGGLQYGFPEDLCEICWFYDRDAVPSMPGGPIQVNLFARMVGDPRPFFEVCRRMRLEGRKPFLVFREGE